MPLRRPGRLPDFEYIGRITYSVTITTFHRRPAFKDAAFARIARDKLLRTAKKFAFALIAYSLMPDHVHLLVQGERDDSDFEAFIKSWNTQTGFAWRQRGNATLWQPGYFESVIRNDGNLYHAARYILMNPVRAGLVKKASEYEFSGSTRYKLEYFLEDDER
jgi:putative transposase